MRRTLLLLACLPLLVTAAPSSAASTVSVSIVGTVNLAEPDGAAFISAACAAHSDGTNTVLTEVWCEVAGFREYRGVPGWAAAQLWFGAVELPETLCAYGKATSRTLQVTNTSRCITLTADCPRFVVVDNGTLHCLEPEPLPVG